MREELIKQEIENIIHDGFMEKDDFSFIAGQILKDFLVLRKSEARTYEVSRCEDCVIDQTSKACPIGWEGCRVSQVIVISKEK